MYIVNGGATLLVETQLVEWNVGIISANLKVFTALMQSSLEPKKQRNWETIGPVTKA